MTCPSCGHANPESQKFCGECGTKLPEPGRCAACGHMNPPANKFCGECGGTLAAPPVPPLSCARCGAVLASGTRFCGACGEAVGGAATPSPAGGAAASRLPSPPDVTPARAPSGERKIVTVLFADVSGFTAMSEKLDPEEVTVIMNRCFDALGRPITKHGGTIDKFIGDCVMALFGAPIAHENDPERACRAAIEMQAALTELNRTLPIPLAVNVGINSGRVVAGEVGTEGRRDYTVMGDAVNTAQRIQSAAKGGRTYVSESVERAVHDLFELVELDAIKAKGKEQPVAVFELVGLRRATAEDAITTRPLVGRERELARLDDALAAAATGHGAFLAILGEAGIGKTRLRDEAARRALGRGFEVVLGQAFDHRQGLPFGPVLDLLRRATGIAEGDRRDEARAKLERALGELELSDGDRRLLARDLGLVDDDARSDAKAARFAPYLELARALARRRPTLVMVEDLHWADGPTLELLSLVADETAERPLLLLVTGRPGATVPDGVRVHPDAIALAELEPFDAHRLLSTLLGERKLDAALQEALLRRAGGNPFFIEELVRSAEGGSLSADDLPDSVQAVVSARIDRLPADDKWILQAASVLGRELAVPLLERVAERSPLTDALARLERESLVDLRRDTTPPLASFRQAITAEAAYASLLKQTARPLHLRAARAILELFADRLEERHAELARHFVLGGDLSEAIEHTVRAAQADQRAFALDKAEETFREARALLGELDADDGAPSRRTTGAWQPRATAEVPASRRDRWNLEIAVGLGEVHRIHGRWDLAWSELERAAGIALRLGERVAETAGALARIAFVKGDFTEAARRGEDALALARERDDRRAVAQIQNLLGNVAERQGRRDDAERLLTESVALWHELGDARGEAWALADLGIALMNGGRLDAALEAQERSLELKKKIDDRLGIAASLVNVGNIHGMRGELRRARDCHEQALEIYRILGDRKGTASALHNISLCEQRLGDLSAAERRNQQALHLQTSIGDQPGRVATLVTRGFLYRLANDFEAAVHAYEEARRTADSSGYRLGTAAALAGLGTIRFEMRDYPQAVDDLTEALELFEPYADESSLRELRLYVEASEVLREPDRPRLDVLSTFESEPADFEGRLQFLLTRAVVSHRLGHRQVAEDDLESSRQLVRERHDPLFHLLVERIERLLGLAALDERLT